MGFGRANNQALTRTRARYVLLLNTDAFVSPDTLTKTVEFMDAHPRCGVLGVKLVGLDGKLQPSCRYFPTPWNAFCTSNKVGIWIRQRFFPRMRLVDDMDWDHASVRACDWVPGCYYMVRREVIERVGLFDPRYFLYFEEVDHCRAVRQAGWSVVYYPFTQVVHIGGESAETEGPLDAGRQITALHIESQLMYFRKHHGLVGLVAGTFLSVLGNSIVACNNIFRSGDRTRALAATRRAWTMAKSLGATRFGSRATR